MTSAVEWLAPFEDFLKKTGLQQTLRALQVEALVLPFKPTSDTKDSLGTLSEDIQHYLAQTKRTASEQQDEASKDKESVSNGTGNDGRKDSIQDIVQSSLDRDQTTQKMDEFIAQQRKGIDRSNRDEFLTASSSSESCARTDAKGTNCGVKLQAELVQNNNTALGRSMDQASKQSVEDKLVPAESLPLSGLEERVENIRDHLNVQFVPESTDVHRRVSALEDRIMMLEREFPPWSAEHFNQPRRRYTQPPPATVYRILPPAPTTASSSFVSTPAPARAAALPHKTQAQKAQPRATPRQQTQPPAKRKKASYINSPLDKSGRPIFHACGRGVNSSLTRSVLAQLQGKPKDVPAEAGSSRTPPSAARDEK
ncbi:hypothetical protein IW147_003224 [Coemansia sp. RSA 720]|nr:hypothetical protein IW147_003224 [Coemansia sp. RSA 720]